MRHGNNRERVRRASRWDDFVRTDVHRSRLERSAQYRQRLADAVAEGPFRAIGELELRGGRAVAGDEQEESSCAGMLVWVFEKIVERVAQGAYLG